MCYSVQSQGFNYTAGFFHMMTVNPVHNTQAIWHDLVRKSPFFPPFSVLSAKHQNADTVYFPLSCPVKFNLLLITH